LVMQSIFTSHGIMKDVGQQLGIYRDMYEKRSDVLRQMFDEYVTQVEQKKGGIEKYMQKAGQLILAVYGRVQNGRDRMLGRIKAYGRRVGYDIKELDFIAVRLQELISSNQEEVGRLRSKAENVQDFAAQLLGIAQDLVDAKKEADKKIAVLSVMEGVKSPEKPIEKKESIDSQAEVGVMEPAVKEEEAIQVSRADVSADLGAIIAKLNVFEAMLETFDAMLEDLDQDTEETFAEPEQAPA